MGYMDRKVACDVAKTVHIGLEATLKDIHKKIERCEELEFLLEESKSRTLAVEDVIKSPRKQPPKLEDTIAARSLKKLRKIALSESLLDTPGKENPFEEYTSEQYMPHSPEGYPSPKTLLLSPV